MADVLARFNSGYVALAFLGFGLLLAALLSLEWVPDMLALVFLVLLSLFFAVCFGIAFVWERSSKDDDVPRGRWYAAAAGIGTISILAVAVDGLVLPGLDARSAPLFVALGFSGVAAGALMHWKGGQHLGHTVLAGLFGASSSLVATMVFWVAGAGA